ncbi:MAG: UvrD-helicase domain-containing protein, partial [Myxococcota bacterium]
MSGYWARPAVLDQISPEFDAVIEASAGTGKTYTLEHLVIDLVLRRGLRLEEILVVTFTEKAAAELAQRLRTAMVKIRTGPWPDDAGWRIDEEAQARLGRALTSFDAASISTIHAFCKRMLAEHAFVNGRLFREELVDGRAAFQETFLDVVRKTLATDPALTPYVTAWLQRDTLDMLTERLYEAHTRGGVIAPPYDEPALISTLKSMSRLELTPTVVKPTLKRAGLRAPTIAACLNRIKVLRAVVEAFHKDQNPAAALAQLEDEDGRRRAEGGLFEYLHKSLAPVVDDIPRLVELHRAFDLLDQARVPLDSAIVQVALPVVQAALATDKRTSGRFDFDDMLRLLDQALEGPARDALLATLRRRFKIALIDEFQDTDRVQWSIFRRVFAESPHHRLVVIGDPKQAIYGFRGADVHTYLDAREHLTGAKTSVVHLTQTYRATP